LAQPDNLTYDPGDSWLRPDRVSKEIEEELIKYKTVKNLNWLLGRAWKEWEKPRRPNPNKSNVEWWNKKKLKDARITIKRIRISFEKKKLKKN